MTLDVKRILRVLAVLAWLVIGSFFGVLFSGGDKVPPTPFFYEAIKSSFTSSIIFAILIASPTCLALKGKVFVRIIWVCLFGVLLAVFFTSIGGIFTLRQFPKYKNEIGTYRVDASCEIVCNRYPIYGFETVDKVEDILEYYEPQLNRKGLKINIHYRSLEDTRLTAQESKEVPLFFLSVSCKNTGRTISNFTIWEYPEITKAQFKVTQGGGLFAPLTPCY